jgi:ubiquitin-conjugating enzyme E2 variant
MEIHYHYDAQKTHWWSLVNDALVATLAVGLFWVVTNAARPCVATGVVLFALRRSAFVAAAYLMADFVAGLFHFLEDNFFSPDSPFIGSTIRFNREHHTRPRDVLRYTYWQTIRTSCVFGVVVITALAVVGRLTWFSALVIAFAVNANQIHKFSHTSASDLPQWVRTLQAVGVFQSKHYKHHRGSFDTHYCPMTDVVNPLLDRSHFWFALRRVLLWCGLPPASE